MSKRSYYIINGITFYRLIAAPFLLYLIITRQLDLFKWLLGVSFFTDLIDGYLARKYKVTSVIGAKLDSIADDMTIVVALIGLVVFRAEFVLEIYPWLIVVLGLFIVQTGAALIRYRKITSFHTYLAKLAALFQGSFLILMFFFPKPVWPLFYLAMVVTALDLIEETIMVLLLPEWKADIKGLYWLLKGKKATFK